MNIVYIYLDADSRCNLQQSLTRGEVLPYLFGGPYMRSHLPRWRLHEQGCMWIGVTLAPAWNGNC